jgi:hypothetical protein
LETTQSTLEKEIEYLKNDVTLYKSSYLKMCEQSFEKNLNMTDKTFELANKSMSTTKFVTKYLTHAPPLIMDKKEITGLLEYTPDKKYKPIDYIFSSYDNKQLCDWIGDLIIKIYKKENPFDQSVWATDTSRFSFLVCQVVQNASGKRNEWITDKSGHKVTEIIIDPTLELLKKMLNKYIEELDKNFNIHTVDIKQFHKIACDKQKAFDIITDIGNDKLNKDVLKYITPILFADIVTIEDMISKTSKKSKKSIVSTDSVSSDSSTESLESEKPKKKHTKKKSSDSIKKQSKKPDKIKKNK